MAHTPGPWFASPIQTDDDGWTYATVGPFDVRGKAFENHVEDKIAEVHGVNYSHELEANAFLIAAAPDLLEAARLAALNFKRASAGGADLGDDDHEAWSALTAAIAKAEGQ